MKKIKLLFLLIVASFCTGCTVEYNINITKDNIDETILVNDYITHSRTENEILSHYNMWYPVFVNYIKSGETIELEDFSQKANGIKYYDKNITKIDNGYQYTYNYKYDIDEYYDSYALATAFVTPNVYKSHSSLVLKTSKKNLLCNYDYFDELKVNITIDPTIYKLNYTNSTNIKNNTYTWILDRSDCDDSQIILTLDNIYNNSIDNDGKQVNNQKKENEYIMYIFCGIIIIVILIVSHLINKLKQKNSKENEDD